jgi:hypothetical protein
VLAALLSLLLATSTPHITVATSVASATVKPGSKISLFVDVIPDPNIHVYAPGAKDYLPIALEFERAVPGITVGKLTYPKSQVLFFEPLKEQVPVYQTPFRLVQEVTVATSVKPGRITLPGVLKYQACDDKICFNPVSAPISWTIEVK